MAVFVVTSVSGSPGATTTALGLALHWPSEVLLIDADPVGGSAIFAGYYKGGVQHPDTLVELTMAHRSGSLGRAMAESALKLTETASFIPGPATAEQASGREAFWAAMAREAQELSQVGVDVIVDLGRLGHQHTATAFVRAADQVLLAMRSDLVALAAVRAASLDGIDSLVPLVIGSGRPYSLSAIGKTLGWSDPRDLPWEPQQATVFSNGTAPVKRWWGKPSSGLAQAYRQLADGLRWRAEADQRREEAEVNGL